MSILNRAHKNDFSIILEQLGFTYKDGSWHLYGGRNSIRLQFRKEFTSDLELCDIFIEVPGYSLWKTIPSDWKYFKYLIWKLSNEYPSLNQLLDLFNINEYFK